MKRNQVHICFVVPTINERLESCQTVKPQPIIEEKREASQATNDRVQAMKWLMWRFPYYASEGVPFSIVEESVPYDGGSAGLAIALACLSAVAPAKPLLRFLLAQGPIWATGTLEPSPTPDDTGSAYIEPVDYSTFKLKVLGFLSETEKNKSRQTFIVPRDNWGEFEQANKIVASNFNVIDIRKLGSTVGRFYPEFYKNHQPVILTIGAGSQELDEIANAFFDTSSRRSLKDRTNRAIFSIFVSTTLRLIFIGSIGGDLIFTLIQTKFFSYREGWIFLACFGTIALILALLIPSSWSDFSPNQKSKTIWRDTVVQKILVPFCWSLAGIGALANSATFGAPIPKRTRILGLALTLQAAAFFLLPEFIMRAAVTFTATIVSVLWGCSFGTITRARCPVGPHRIGSLMSAIMVFVLFGIFSIFPIEQIFLMTAIIFGFEWYIPRLHDQALWRHSFFSQLVRGYFLLTALMIALVPLACEISKRFLQMFFKSGLDRIDIAQYIIGLLLSLMIGSIQWNAVERRALQLVGYGDLWSIRTSIRADRTSAG